LIIESNLVYEHREKCVKFALPQPSLAVAPRWHPLVLTAVDSRTNPASTAGTAQHDLDLVSG
jgi:hypothetical protein